MSVTVSGRATVVRLGHPDANLLEILRTAVRFKSMICSRRHCQKTSAPTSVKVCGRVTVVRLGHSDAKNLPTLCSAVRLKSMTCSCWHSRKKPSPTAQ